MDEPSPRTETMDEPPATLIAGPCSAETREQVLETALQLASIGVTHYRASLWKPRTRPGSFEGVGLSGLAWLQEVRQRTHMQVGTELCLPEQAQPLIDGGIDFIWLGARTVSSPHTIDRIAEALRGSSISVFVKNPISPDTSLWLGAIERLKARGVDRVSAVLRGCTPVQPTRLRNYPHWTMATQLKQLYSDRFAGEQISVLLDPSHIAGDAQLVESICMAGRLYPIDGWMIETHAHPTEAWTDAAQQLTPQQLQRLIDRLYHTAPGEEDLLAPLRYQMQDLDDMIIDLLSERQTIARQIGLFKRKHGLTPFQESAYRASAHRYAYRAAEVGLESSFALQLYELIHQSSVRLQQAMMQQTPTEELPRQE